ncbi:hypothetical protein sos41_42270 [Alphaproteobacteria bacterium SO-S41]|nr:hypothetical protein sos41_42270 [Alphaproteobacteria bacterium SO-S41]
MLHRVMTALVLTATLSTIPAHAAPGDVWHLQKIVMVDKLDEKAEVIDHYADTYGGHAVVQVDGALGSICPGDGATMNFFWGIDSREIFEGAVIPILLSSNELTDTPCMKLIGAKAYVTAAGSDTKLPPPLSAKTMKAVDTRRFITVGDDDRSYPAEKTGSQRRLMLVAADPLPGKPYAYFQVRVVIPGSERELRFIYVYSKDPAPAGSLDIGTPPPPPG